MNSQTQSTRTPWWVNALLLCACGLCVAVLAKGCDDGLVAAHAQTLTTVADAVTQVLQQVSTEVHYSPAENLEAIDLTELDAAQHSVDVASYAMDDRAIADELVKLGQRGVVVRIYRDQVQHVGEVAHGVKGQTDLNQLFRGQPNIHVRIKGVQALMHLKAYAVDGMVLREGSANWSVSGEKVQDNSLILLRDPAVVGLFEDDFEEIWNRPSNQAVQ